MNDTENPPEIGPLKNPDWTDEENLQWDSWVNGGVKTADQATADIEKARKLSAQSDSVEPRSDTTATGVEDDDISRRHREELARSGFGDPKKRAELERREAEGDARLAAALEEEMREGRAFHQRLSEVSPPPEDTQK